MYWVTSQAVGVGVGLVSQSLRLCQMRPMDLHISYLWPLKAGPPYPQAEEYLLFFFFFKLPICLEMTEISGNRKRTPCSSAEHPHPSNSSPSLGLTSPGSGRGRGQGGWALAGGQEAPLPGNKSFFFFFSFWKAWCKLGEMGEGRQEGTWGQF